MTTSSLPPSATPPVTLTARSPEDLLAVVRVVLGFEPSQSVVLLTLGARHQFHARIDLPPPDEGPDALEEMAAALLRPVLSHGVRAAAVVVFTDDRHQARRAARLLRRRFQRAGVACLDALLAHDGRWHPLLRSLPGVRAGVPYDVTAHPFVAGAVLDGRVLHASRAALAATLAPDAASIASVEAQRPTAPLDPHDVAALVARHVRDRTRPEPGETARLLESLVATAARDAAWSAVTRAEARRHVELWSGLVRASPSDLVAHAAGVLAFVAWVAGDGALAWCGVDRALAAEPDHSLALLVGDLLESAVPPAAWDQHRARPPWLGTAS